MSEVEINNTFTDLFLVGRLNFSRCSVIRNVAVPESKLHRAEVELSA